MTSYKEIITKAVIGKGKKNTKENREVVINNIDNVLGCWIINHRFNGVTNNNQIKVVGSYDVNLWYSLDNNSKTNVIIKSFNYSDNMNITLKNNASISNDSEILVRCLSQPNVIDAKVEDGKVLLEIEKQMGIEVIGNTMVKVSVEDDLNDYEEILDDDINEDYLS